MNDQNELLEYSGKLKQARYQIRPDNTSYYEIYSFFNDLQDKYQTDDDQHNDLKQQHDDDEEQRDNILLDYHLFSFNLRFAPWMHFAIQCFTRIALVVLIVEISVQNYSENYGTYYTTVHDTTSVTIAEYWLFYLVCGEFMYEVGCVLELLKPKDVIDLASFFYYCGKHYKSRLGITLDWISVFLLMLWGFFRFTALGVIGDLDVSRVILAVDAIPLTLSLFRFTSFYKPLGELLFTFQKIINDIIVFGIFYFLIIVGFGTAIFCLFRNSAEFPSVGLMFLTLFESSLGSFDFDIFNTNSVVVNTIGILTLVTFLVVIPLITINLFIARLSYIYEKIHLKAEEERAFVKSHFIARYLHLKEVHPLCMLPPPFNMLTGLAAFLHWCYSFCKKLYLRAIFIDIGNNSMPVDERLRPEDSSIKQKILRYPESFSGTVANLLLSISPVGVIIRICPLLVLLYRRVLNRRKRYGNRNKYSLWFWFPMFPLLMLLYMMKLFLSFLVPFFYSNYHKHIEEIVDLESKEYVFINLFSSPDQGESQAAARKRSRSLARSFSSSKQYEDTLLYITEDDSESKDNHIQLNPVLSATATPVVVAGKEAKDKPAAPSKTGLILNLDCYLGTNQKLFTPNDIENILRPLIRYSKCKDEENDHDSLF
jgi:hypothetical protein